MKTCRVLNFSNTIHCNHGFTMLSIIVMMFLLVALVSAGVMMSGPLAKQGRVRDTNTIINNLVEKIVQDADYKKNNPKTLPLTFPDPLGYPNPVDSWGYKLVYVTDPKLQESSNSTKNLGFCNITSTKLRVNNVKNIAFAIISKGDNISFNTSINSAILSGTSSNINIITDSYIVTPANQASAPDIIKYVTLEELKNRTGCFRPKQILPSLDIANEVITSISPPTASQPYSSDPLVAEGGKIFAYKSPSYNRLDYYSGTPGGEGSLLWPKYGGNGEQTPYTFTLIKPPTPEWLTIDHKKISTPGFTDGEVHIHPTQIILKSTGNVPGPAGNYTVIIELSDTTWATTGKPTNTIRKTFTLKVN